MIVIDYIKFVYESIQRDAETIKKIILGVCFVILPFVLVNFPIMYFLPPHALGIFLFIVGNILAVINIPFAIDFCSKRWGI